MSRPPRDPREHWCEAVGCLAWGAFGVGLRWWCDRHRPVESVAGIRAKEKPAAPAADQGRLL